MCFSLKKMSALSIMVCALLVFGTNDSVAGTAQNSDEAANDKVLISNAEELLLSTNEMGESRGTAGTINTITSAQTLASTTAGNSMNVGGDMTNGDISLGDNMGGFGSYVMNTGNNSTINSAVSVNVQIMPAAPAAAP